MIMGGRVAATRLKASMFRERPFLSAGAFRPVPAEDIRSLPDGAYGPMDLSVLPVSRTSTALTAQARWNIVPRPATAAA